MLAAPRQNCRLFRNNVGLFKTADGRVVKTGLHNGSSDLIGWTEIVIKPEMVGKKIAVFTAIECKRNDKAAKSEEQKNFVEQVKKSGGYAGFAACEEDFKNIIK